MNILPKINQKKLIVISARHRIGDQIARLIAGLALHGMVTVLDGGNRFPAYQAVRMLRGLTHDLVPAAKRIVIRRAFTCHQMLELLESTPALPQPHIVLDLLATFQDENVPLAEVRRLLDRCLLQLDRLKMMAPVIVTLTPSQEERAVLEEKIRSHADQVIEIELPIPTITQPSLF